MEKYPGEVEAYYWAADYIFHIGWYEDSLPLWERAAQIDPSFSTHASHLAVTYYFLGRIPEGIAAARRAFEIDPTPENEGGLALALVAEGRIEEGTEALLKDARRARAARNDARYLVFALLAAGELDEAEAEARSLPERPGLSLGRDDVVRRVLVAQGRYREAFALNGSGLMGTFGHLRGDLAGVRASAPKVDATTDRQSFRPAFGSAMSLAELGAQEEADRLFAAALSHWPQERCREGPDWGVCDPLFVAGTAAVLRFWRGERAHGLAEVRAIAAKRWDFWNFRLGILESEAGNDPEAIEALRRFDRSYWIPFGNREVWRPRSAFLQARSLERLGRKDEARATIEKLLGWWKRADPDIPMLTEAKALAKRVGAKVP
jgi:tetratricopeptide (TPR) repeat protein